jgi:hypothetical protein
LYQHKKKGKEKVHTAYCAACASPFLFFSLQASKGAILENSAAGGGGAAGGGPKGLPECGVLCCAVLRCGAHCGASPWKKKKKTCASCTT